MRRFEHRGEVFELSESPITLNGVQALTIRIVHEASRRMKTGATALQPETLIRSLVEDLCGDLDDVQAGIIPPEAGRFDL